jgi:hypothetical protein
LAEEIRRIRRKGLARRRRTPRLKWWRERDYLDGEVTAGVIILPTSGCAWGATGGCSMCGYVYDSAPTSQEELLRDFREGLKSVGEVDYLKIFNSGSFFDIRELERETYAEIFSEINKKPGIKQVQVEARPEYLDSLSLLEVVEALNPILEVGIGLESARDYVRENCINKGFTLEDFKKVTRACREVGIEVKAYLLVKPPFITEKEAIEDAVRSAFLALRYGASRVSLNPVAVHRDTLVDELWRRREYTPPWLWSIVEIMWRIRRKVSSPILSHPTGAGKLRGAHNCGRCDAEVYNAIVDFSATQRDAFLEKTMDTGCDCRAIWKAQLVLEGFAQGSFPAGLRFS